jgi:hypothetical protein
LLCRFLLAERCPYPEIYTALQVLPKVLIRAWPRAYLEFEMVLIQALGYGVLEETLQDDPAKLRFVQAQFARHIPHNKAIEQARERLFSQMLRQANPRAL